MSVSSIRCKGKLIKWNEKNGFGFIKPEYGEQDVFVHLSKFKDATRSPTVGDTIHYQLAVREDGKRQAVKATIEGAMNQPALLKPWGLIFFCLLGAVHLLWQTTNLRSTTLNWFPINASPLFLYVLMSLITYIVYARDKYYAIRSSWRIEENSLHLLEALGGWPGALMAQRSFQHKSMKPSYQRYFWSIVSLHVGGWIAWFWAVL